MKIGFGTKDIGTLNWESLVALKNMDTVEAEKILPLFRNNYVLPQVMALLASTKFVLQRNEAGKVSITDSLRAWTPKLDAGEIAFAKGQVMSKLDFIGILRFLKFESRKSILPEGTKQVSPEWVRFNSSVPLFMSAFKEYRNLRYSDWDLEDKFLDQVTEPKMLQLLKMQGAELGWTSEDLIKFRETARTVKTGARAGTIKHLNSTTTIGKVGDEEFDKLPALVKVMLLQTWIFQPELATPLGIYNLTNLDASATPLVDLGIMNPRKSSTATDGDVEW